MERKKNNRISGSFSDTKKKTLIVIILIAVLVLIIGFGFDRDLLRDPSTVSNISNLAEGYENTTLSYMTNKLLLPV
ncbi:hypothetical protein [Candidatus Nitrosocosmicus franklandus]|uniref:Uncharacterized protein n=1 Tax=Candidatus Nitrosocosmicus franklandianus TaxID=1798806 RepID=A0A484IAW8_9ARCH|nr:hypothetical protein [Candidatus Nitrosocosmicus franklandus]VFJ14902.1 protein of unknown function [Candidatus Nitrosocosmicus franklandus]